MRPQSISTTGGHMDGRGALNDDLVAHLPDPENLCDSVESCRRVVRRQIDRGADVIKFATTGGVNSGTGLATRMYEDEAKALVDTAHAYGRKVAVHAHGADGIKLAVRAGADSIEHGTVMDDEIIKLMKANGTYYVPTLSTVNGYLERLAKDPNAYTPDVRKQIDWRIGITGQSLAKAYPAGVKIAFGTDAGVSKHGRNADEFELMVKFGMPPVEAMKAATVNAADLLGLSQRGRHDRARQERRHHRGDRRPAAGRNRPEEGRICHGPRRTGGPVGALLPFVGPGQLRTSDQMPFGPRFYILGLGFGRNFQAVDVECEQLEAVTVGSVAIRRAGPAIAAFSEVIAGL